MTAAIPVAAERVAAGRVAGAAGNAGAVSQAKKTLTGKNGSSANRQRESAPPERDNSRASTSGTSSPSSGHGRGARPRRSGPRSARPMQPHVRVLVVEWLLAVILITVTVPSEKGGKGYPDMMATMMLRLSAATGIFFALSLIGTAQRAAKFAMWFGFIVDLGIIYHASTQRSGKALSALFTGQSILSDSGGATLAADFTDKSAPPQPTPFGGPAPTGPAGGSVNTSPGTSSGGGGAQLSPNYPGGPGSTIPTPGVPGQA